MAMQGKVIRQIVKFLSECGKKYASVGAIGTRAGALNQRCLGAYLTDLVRRGYLERLNLAALRFGIVSNEPQNGGHGKKRLATLLDGHQKLPMSEFLKLLREQGVLFKEAREITSQQVVYRLTETGRQCWETNIDGQVADLLIPHQNENDH